jgi:hypothetical protein
MAMDQNITYLNLDSGIVKTCHHAVFDEAWYLQPTRPPAAHLLYNLGLETETKSMSSTGPLHQMAPGTVTPISVPWPPLPPGPILNAKLWKLPPLSLYTPLPLWIMDAPHTVGARAARLRFQEDHRSKKAIAADVVAEYLIRASDTAMICISLDPYGTAFEEELDLWKFNLN